MNRLAVARQNLAESLEPILDGRVYAYPPPTGRGVAPSIWLEQPAVARTTIGTSSRAIVATFPVWIVGDGATRPAVAVLDDLLSNVWDAVERLGHNTPDIARPQTYTRHDGSTLRAAVLAVDVTIAAVTLCLPGADVVQVPPIPLLEEASVG